MPVINGGMMQERRIRTEDRRKILAMPTVPFKDSNGDIVVLNRRFIPDRRLGNIARKSSPKIR
jgi:hypothetical protein